MMTPRIIVTAAAAIGALSLAACETEASTAPASAKADPAANSAQTTAPEASRDRQRSPNDIGPGAPLEAPPVQ
jgi:hypothetical protein